MEQPTNPPAQQVNDSIPTPQVAPKPETIVAQSGNNQNQIWIYIMIAVILVMLSVGGYYIYQSMMLAKSNTDSAQKELTIASPAPVASTSQKPANQDPEKELDSLTIEDPSASFSDIDKDLQAI